MKKINTKKLVAITLAGAMILGNSVVAFAEDEVSGSGVVEYDNSVAVEYDVVDVPTITAGQYDFTLDPTGQLHTYDPDNYDAGTVYFAATGARAFIEAKENVDLFTLSKSAVTASGGAWSGVVKTVADDAITEVNEGFFVWVPDTDNTTYSAGKPGKFVELTDSNITKWFDLKDANSKTIALRSDYRAGNDICDGNVYENTYTAVTGNKITDSDTDPLSNYVTITSGAPSAFPNLYKEDSGSKVAATAADIEYTAAEAKNLGTTDTVTVINKSTKAKTVTAAITMSNTTGITFKNTNSFTGDTDASMYVAASNGTVTTPLVAAADGATASATYTVELAAPTVAEVTYMAAGENANTGGHNYARYEAYGTTYGHDSFSITAVANSNATDKWNEWAKAITSTTRPNINIVYTVTDKVTNAAPSIANASLRTNSLPGTGDYVTLNVNYGAGNLAATAISSVLISTDGTNFITPAAGNTTFSNTTQTVGVKRDYAANLSAKRWFRVYFDDSTDVYAQFTIEP